MIEKGTKIEDIKAAISTISVKPDDVIIFKFDPDMDPEDIEFIHKVFTEAFKDNQVLGLISNVDYLVDSPKEAIDMLEKMIAKIKLLHPEAASPKILGV